MSYSESLVPAAAEFVCWSVGGGSWFKLGRREAFGYATLASRSRVEQSLATKVWPIGGHACRSLIAVENNSMKSDTILDSRSLNHCSTQLLYVHSSTLDLN
jgi:hypothetical protein